MTGANMRVLTLLCAIIVLIGAAPSGDRDGGPEDMTRRCRPSDYRCHPK